MEPLQLPFFQLEQEEGRYAVFLPGYQPDEVLNKHLEFDTEKEILKIYCQYQSESGQPKTEVYPIAITELNRDEFEAMDKLLLFNPNELDPEELSRDEETREKLSEFFEQLDELTGKQPLGEIDENPDQKDLD